MSWASASEMTSDETSTALRVVVFDGSAAAVLEVYPWSAADGALGALLACGSPGTGTKSATITFAGPTWDGAEAVPPVPHTDIKAALGEALSDTRGAVVVAAAAAAGHGAMTANGGLAAGISISFSVSGSTILIALEPGRRMLPVAGAAPTEG